MSKATSKAKKKTTRVERYFDQMVEAWRRWQAGEPGYDRMVVMLEGHHGIGKTQFTMGHFAERHGLRVVEKSMAQVDPAGFVMNVPQRTASDAERWELLTLLVDELETSGDPYVFLLDEANRVPDRWSANLLMELTSEFSIAGIPLENCVGIVATSNPEGDGYQGLVSGDWAQVRRYQRWLSLDENDIPAKDYLAKKYPDFELGKFFAKRAAMSPEIRRALNWRVVDFFLFACAEGIPQHWVLPWPGEERITLRDSSGEDITADVLTKLAEAVGVPYIHDASDKFDRAVEIATRTGTNLRIVGPSGIGKTSRLKATLAESDLQMVYKSMAICTPEDLAYTVPVGSRLTTILSAELGTENEKVFVAEEFSRAERRTAAAAMSLTGHGAVAGQPIPGLRCVIALDNPKGSGLLAMDSGRLDEAQASRFAMTIEVTEEDMHTREYLSGIYGDQPVQAAFSWRAEDLDEETRPFASAAILEELLRQHRDDLPLVDCLQKLGAERIPLESALYLLEQRFPGRLIGFSAVIAEKDRLIELISDKNADETERAYALTSVHDAFERVDPAELLRHADAAAELYRVLPQDIRTALITGLAGQAERFKAWTTVSRIVTGAAS